MRRLIALLLLAAPAAAEGAEVPSEWTRPDGTVIELDGRTSIDTILVKVREQTADDSAPWSQEVRSNHDGAGEVVDSDTMSLGEDRYEVRDYGPDSALYWLDETGHWKRLRQNKGHGKSWQNGPPPAAGGGDDTIGGLPGVPPAGGILLIRHNVSYVPGEHERLEPVTPRDFADPRQLAPV